MFMVYPIIYPMIIGSSESLESLSLEVVLSKQAKMGCQKIIPSLFQFSHDPIIYPRFHIDYPIIILYWFHYIPVNVIQSWNMNIEWDIPLYYPLIL